MEKFWNIVFYFAYRADYKFYTLFDKIDPFWLFTKLLYCIPVIRNFQEKRGRTLSIMKKEVDEAFKRPDIGISQIFARGLIFLLPIIFFIILLFYYTTFIDKPKKFEPVFVVFILYSIISFLFFYKLLWHKNKYLKYFKEFDKKPRKWKIKWAWISLVVILFPFVVLILSFVAMAN